MGGEDVDGSASGFKSDIMNSFLGDDVLPQCSIRYWCSCREDVYLGHEARLGGAIGKRVHLRGCKQIE